MTILLTDKSELSATTRGSEFGDKGGKYLTFKLGNEQYGIEILKVRELIGLMSITAVPQMPVEMKGVINLRGKVIPVIDLRLKFGMNEIDYTDETCIIVVNVGQEIGIIVDAVSEVLDISGKDIEPPPYLGGSQDASCILGMGKVGEAVKILLDIGKVLTANELSDIAAIATDAVSQDQVEQPAGIDDLKF